MAHKDEYKDASEAARTVALNVSRFRALRRLTLAELTARLDALGHKLSRSSVSEIENLRRRVTVDDLLALSIALDVSPVALLMPQAFDAGSPAAFIGEQTFEAGHAWRALRGDIPWSASDWSRADDADTEYMRRTTWPSWEI